MISSGTSSSGTHHLRPAFVQPSVMATKSLATCLFCKIIKGDIPSFKLLESESSFAFLDIGPLSRGHALVVPKFHAEKLHDLPDEYLVDVLPIAKKIALAQGTPDYNILQNNGRIAHQEVPHVHFHIIPKPIENPDEGLAIGWPAKPMAKDELQKIFEEIKSKLDASPESAV
ncbi:HIT-like domain-containing protein [Flammula alnicola]|nr:HIT-like domain-containing protein [Flammula alnicola]